MRIVLAGTGSAVGKTTISTGIMKALSEETKIQPFKVGPDYIDPTYHTLATGNRSRNLDSFFMSDGQIREAFERAISITDSKMGIIEGVRGLYEGISPTGDVGNTASVAKALNSPVILILNARSLVKSAAAVVLGFKSLDPEIEIEGVILNQVKNQRHYLKAKEAVEKLTDTQVIGGIPRSDSLTVEQRHLGLVPAIERENLLGFIEKWGQVVSENIDLDALKDIMKSARKIPAEREELWKKENTKRVKIGVAQDEIFTFYYQENLEALEDNHAQIVPFSPYHDEQLPDVDALYIGGGYPEIFSKELEKNYSMRNSIKKFHLDERPIYGECGGLMYLTRSIDGHQMCDVFPYPSLMTDKVQGLSYVISEAQEDNIISENGDVYRGHEFHYSKVDIGANKTISPKFAFKILRGRGIIDSKDGLMSKNTVASYVHTHVAACPGFASNLTKNAWEI
jgi:cobyrinic acid a,c-diamide synthase